MSVSLAPQFTQREYRWSEWKLVYGLKGLPFQYDETELLYTIWTYDENEVHITQIWKVNIPENLSVYSQEQNDLDKNDFDVNYKSKGNAALGQIDVDGANIVRVKAAKKGWSFWALPIEFTTSTLGGSVYSKNSSGVDLPGITCKIYDENNTEITTAGLLNVNLNSCVKTVLDFEPTFDYELIGGALRVNSDLTEDVRLWIIGAPDISTAYGGSKEFTSGLNLKFLTIKEPLELDGRVTKYVTYNPTYHSGKIRIMIKHVPGIQAEIQVVIHTYRL